MLSVIALSSGVLDSNEIVLINIFRVLSLVYRLSLKVTVYGCQYPF